MAMSENNVLPESERSEQLLEHIVHKHFSELRELTIVGPILAHFSKANPT